MTSLALPQEYYGRTANPHTYYPFREPLEELGALRERPSSDSQAVLSEAIGELRAVSDRSWARLRKSAEFTATRISALSNYAVSGTDLLAYTIARLYRAIAELRYAIDARRVTFSAAKRVWRAARYATTLLLTV
ncbi:hypothetical protein ACNS7O_17935 (plasmid) [Haloferacaceae archaeon DSL9]